MIDVFFYNPEIRSFGLIKTLGTAGATSIGGTVIGTGLGAVIARKKAQKSAEAKGLRPGTPEYNSYVRNRTLGGAAIGGIGGTLVGGTVGSAIASKGMYDKAKQLGAPGIKDVAKEVKSSINKPKSTVPDITNMTPSQFRTLAKDTSKPLLDF